MKLTAEEVSRIFTDCLYRDGEDTTGHVLVEGITSKFGLHPERVLSHKDEIKQLLTELPIEFKKSGGGGHSFLNGCMDKDGNQWGGQLNVQELFVLGIAAGFGSYPLPRDFWDVLPGGVPYYMVDV